MPITICQIQNTKNRYFSIFLLEVNQISSCMLLPLPHTHFLPRHQEYPSTFLAVRVESTASTIKKWTKRLVRGKMLLKISVHGELEALVNTSFKSSIKPNLFLPSGYLSSQFCHIISIFEIDYSINGCWGTEICLGSGRRRFIGKDFSLYFSWCLPS